MSNRYHPEFAPTVYDYGSGLAMLAGGIRQQLRAVYRRPQPPLFIGGVNVTGVDLAQPFFVDFSVPPNATLQQKRDASGRLAEAYRSFYAWAPYWFLRTDSDVRAGRFIMYAWPNVPAAAYG